MSTKLDANARAFCFSCLITCFAPSFAGAIETGRIKDMHPSDVQTLQFDQFGPVGTETDLGRFILDGWPEGATFGNPIDVGQLVILPGMRQNTAWANPFLLRLEPSGSPWLTSFDGPNGSGHQNIGSGNIAIAFELGICAIGITYAQTGAHNVHYPELRRRTRFSFFSAEGALIDQIDQRPGRFVVSSAFNKQFNEPEIWAITIESEVDVAISELTAMECAMLLG